MPTLYIVDDFRLSMLPRLEQMTHMARTPRPVEDPDDFVRSWAESRDPADEVVSVVGHAGKASLFTELLGIPIAHNRAAIPLKPGDVLLVGQYAGTYLRHDATELPEGATIEWWSL